MKPTAQDLLAEALALPEDERRRLAELLLQSVPREPVKDVERAWNEEIERRIDAAERGETVARDWDEAAAELRAKYAGK